MEAGSVRLLAVLAEISTCYSGSRSCQRRPPGWGKPFGAAAERRLYHDRVRWPPRVPKSVHGGHSSANVSCRSRKSLSRAFSGAAHRYGRRGAALMHHRGLSGLSGTVAFGVAGADPGAAPCQKRCLSFSMPFRRGSLRGQLDADQWRRFRRLENSGMTLAALAALVLVLLLAVLDPDHRSNRAANHSEGIG